MKIQNIKLKSKKHDYSVTVQTKKNKILSKNDMVTFIKGTLWYCEKANKNILNEFFDIPELYTV